MKCVNPKCDAEDLKTTDLDDETPSNFGFFFNRGQFWLRCQKCGTAFRPSKTLDGVEKYK